MSVFPFTEHDGLCECAEKAEFDAMMSSGGFSNIPSSIPNIKSIKDVKYLGIVKDGENLKAHYYIGASWFIKDKCAFVVKPKVEVDYIKLFMTALELNSENEAAYFSNYYYIDFEKPAIIFCITSPCSGILFQGVSRRAMLFGKKTCSPKSVDESCCKGIWRKMFSQKGRIVFFADSRNSRKIFRRTESSKRPCRSLFVS